MIKINEVRCEGVKEEVEMGKRFAKGFEWKRDGKFNLIFSIFFTNFPDQIITKISH